MMLITLIFFNFFYGISFCADVRGFKNAGYMDLENVAELLLHDVEVSDSPLEMKNSEHKVIFSCLDFNMKTVKTSFTSFTVVMENRKEESFTAFENCQMNINFFGGDGYQKKYYYLSLSREVVLDIGPCDQEILVIKQGDYAQAYCGGIFSITEFPLEKSNVTIYYKSNLKKGRREVRLPFEVTVNYAQMYSSKPDRLEIYTDVFRYSDVSNKAKTYDPKYSSLQICPKECGGAFDKIDNSPISGSYRIGSKMGMSGVLNHSWYVELIVELLQISGEKVVRLCGGSILTSQTVLTVATCLIPNPKSWNNKFTNQTKVTVTVISRRGHDEMEQRIPGHRFVIHEDFKVVNEYSSKVEYLNNIALIKMEKGFELGLSATPICIDVSEHPFPFKAEFLGYTRIIEKFPSSEMDTRKAGMFSNGTTTNDLISALLLSSSGEETCGFPGSPVAVISRNSAYQVGMISPGFDCEEYLKNTKYSLKIQLVSIRKHLKFLEGNKNSELCS